MVSAPTMAMRPLRVASKSRQRAGDRAPGHVALGHLDDRALMAKIADGDAAALDQLYIRYRSLAFAAAPRNLCTE